MEEIEGGTEQVAVIHGDLSDKGGVNFLVHSWIV